MACNEVIPPSSDTDEMSSQLPLSQVSDLDLLSPTSDLDLLLPTSGVYHYSQESQQNQPWSVRSRTQARSFVFVSEEAFNDKSKIRKLFSNISLIKEDSPTSCAHNILQQLSVDSEMEQKLKDDHELTDMDTMDDATRYFYNFLKTNKLDKYFRKFKENECCDIRDIEYLMDDMDFLTINIGITHPIHIKKLVAEFTNLKHKMNYFKNNGIIPDILIEKLLRKGIVTMDILCSEIESKSDLKNKLGICNDNQCKLLWTIIDPQINPYKAGALVEGDLRTLRKRMVHHLDKPN